MPFIDEPEQAEFVVACTRYPPEGRRGAAFVIGHDDYSPGDVRQKMQSANAQTLVVVQIESARGLENVEKIAAVRGVDAVWIGQFDLTASLGIPGDVKHPEFQAAQQRILRACQNAGVAAGYGSLFLDDVVAARAAGFRFLVYTADLWIYQRALRDGLKTIRGEK
jgi:2-dehydro-3-deoxyglucarate aldolase/4-hydroxy-2-oxoheptanedioate aldolase